MNQRFTYSIPAHALSILATASHICVAEPRPHTYGVRHLPCGSLDTPFRHTTYRFWPRQATSVWRNLRQYPCNDGTFTFSAKEKDAETGLSYFGSRYYSSDLSIWLSVDPQSDKYASLSPYVYCADNPVKLMDPNGEEVWIIGDDATAVTKAFEQLQSSTSYTLQLSDNGKVEIIGGKAEYDDDKLLAKAINDNTIRVNVTAINGNSDDNVLGGAFMGNKVSTAKPSFTIPKPYQIIQGIAARCVNTYQTVDPFELEILDNIGVNSDGTKAWPGQCMLHEVTESYCGGLLAYRSGVSAGNALKSPFAYNIAHNAATAQPDFDAEDKWQLNEMVRQIRKK